MSQKFKKKDEKMSEKSLFKLHREGFLEVTPLQKYSVYQVKAIFNQLVLKCREYKVNRTLINVSVWQEDIDIFDRYHIAEHMAGKRELQLKMAFIVNEHQFVPDRFFENAAVNLGLHAKIFLDKNEAIEWLLQE